MRATPKLARNRYATRASGTSDGFVARAALPTRRSLLPLGGDELAILLGDLVSIATLEQSPLLHGHLSCIALILRPQIGRIKTLQNLVVVSIVEIHADIRDGLADGLLNGSSCWEIDFAMECLSAKSSRGPAKRGTYLASKPSKRFSKMQGTSATVAT